jgi:hypothetical protein
LKKSFVAVLVLHHFHPERKIMVETDASNPVIACMLAQYDNDDILHPLTYFSRKYSPVKINSEIYDKELLTIVCAFEEWYSLQEGSPHTTEVVSNY